MIIRVLRPLDLSKGIDKSKLVLVERQEMRNGKQHRTHRWINPNKGMNMAKKVIKKKLGMDGPVAFEKDGKPVSDKEIIKEYMALKKRPTLEQFIAKTYKMVKKEEKAKKPEERSKLQGYFKKVSKKIFQKDLLSAKMKVEKDKAWRVDVHTLSEYNETDLYTTRHGSTFAITKNKDIVSVCRVKTDSLSGKEIMAKAVEKGGIKLDSFEGNHKFYRKCGFEAVSWCKWDGDYAPEGWKPEYDGEDVIFYKYTGNFPKSKDEIESADDFKKRVPVSKDYDEAHEKREDSLKKGGIGHEKANL